MNKIISLNDLLVIYNLPSHLVVVINMEGAVEYVNESLAPLLGYWEENLLGKPFASIVHPDDNPNEILEFYKNDGKTYTHQAIKRLRSSDGAYRFFSFSFTKPEDKACIYAIGHDCTEKMELEELFRLSSLKHMSPKGISVIDQNMKLLWLNESFTRLTGYDRNDLIDKHLFNTLSGELTIPGNNEYLESKINKGLAFTSEGIYYHKNGKHFWMRIDGQPLFDNDSEAPKWFLVHSDVTGQKAQSDKLFIAEPCDPQSEEKEISCIFFDRDTSQVVGANTSAVAMYQYSAEEFQSLSLKDLLADSTNPNTAKIEALLSGSDTGMRYSYHKKKNGDIIKVKSAYCVTTYQGNTVIVSTHQYITTISKGQTALDRNELLRNIAWKQSHLMRSPLTNLKSLMIFLKEDPGHQEYMIYMQNELEKLDNIIKEMVYETSITIALDDQTGGKTFP
jgi:PAS domain S-box-containing protein